MKTDAEYVPALQKSQGPVAVVARHLEHMGFRVYVPELKIRPEFAERMEFIDKGDIMLVGGFTAPRVEVKGTGIQFGESGWPMDYRIVDEVWKVDEKPWNTLYGYYTVSPCQKWLLFIPPSTAHLWTVTRLFDYSDRSEKDYYICPKEYCEVIRAMG